MICLKRHDEDICNLSIEEVCELWDIIRRLKGVLISCFQPDHFNYTFLMNQDAHVHLHVIPRYQSKRMFARVEFQDNDEITNRKLPEAVQQEIVAALRNGMKG